MNRCIPHSQNFLLQLKKYKVYKNCQDGRPCATAYPPVCRETPPHASCRCGRSGVSVRLSCPRTGVRRASGGPWRRPRWCRRCAPPVAWWPSRWTPGNWRGWRRCVGGWTPTVSHRGLLLKRNGLGLVNRHALESDYLYKLRKVGTKYFEIA